MNKLKEICEQYDVLLQNKRKCKSSDASIQRFTDFRSKAENLFDLAQCRCINSETCFCDENFQVPLIAQNFFKDQRDKRCMTLMQVVRQSRGQQCNKNDEAEEENDSPLLSLTQASGSSGVTAGDFSQVEQKTVIKYRF